MKTIKISLVLAGLLMVGFLFLISDDTDILIESRESKTVQGRPVFNRIKRINRDGQTIWMMQQSHDGSACKGDCWERLAIAVNSSRKTAEYFQLKSGPFEWNKNAAPDPAHDPKGLRVACFMCHPNGPRVIRPNYDSPLAPIALKDRLRIGIWNIQTKLQGRIPESAAELRKDQTTRVGQLPFRFRGAFENQILNVRPCIFCHTESGVFARGPLVRQNFMAIRFMVENGIMPPKGFSLSETERRAVLSFAAGF